MSTEDVYRILLLKFGYAQRVYSLMYEKMVSGEIEEAHAAVMKLGAVLNSVMMKEPPVVPDVTEVPNNVIDFMALAPKSKTVH